MSTLYFFFYFFRSRFQVPFHLTTNTLFCSLFFLSFFLFVMHTHFYHVLTLSLNISFPFFFLLLLLSFLTVDISLASQAVCFFSWVCLFPLFFPFPLSSFSTFFYPSCHAWIVMITKRSLSIQCGRPQKHTRKRELRYSKEKRRLADNVWFIHHQLLTLSREGLKSKSKSK